MVDAHEYHERTAHSPRSVRESSHRLDPRTKPRPYKVYTSLPKVAARRSDSPDVPALAAIRQATWDPEGGGSEAQGGDGLEAQAVPLGTLCHYSTGVTKRIERQGQTVPFRAAACTGKLYHVDCYAVTGPSGPDGAGVYHYDPHEDRFDVLRDGDFRATLAEAAGDGTGIEEAPVTVVATSTWWRNAWKYRARTYRHAFWDAGTILANLLGVAHGYGYRAGVLSGFADGVVTDLLGVDPTWEAPLALLPVGTWAPASPAPPLDPIDPETEPVSPDTVDYPLIHEAWEQSRLSDGDGAAEWRGRAAAHEGTGTVSRGDGEIVHLDPVDAETASGRPVVETIERRGSLREYSHEPISDRLLATVLDRALSGLPTDGWLADTGATGAGDGRAPGQFVDTYCLIHAVEGIPSGAYQYHPEPGVLERIGDTDRSTAAHLALDQSVVGDAAVNVYCMADVDAVVEALGNRGYRLAMLEAGLTLGRLYLSTYAHLALGGRGFTFYDDRVTEHLAPRAASQQPMTLFAFGRPDL